MEDLREILSDLRAALTAQERLVEEVSSLKARSHYIIAGLVLGLVLLVGLGATAVVSRNAADSALKNAEAVSDLVDQQVTVVQQQVADRDAATRSTCLIRNSASMQTRLTFLAAYDALETIVLTPEAVESVRRLREAIPSAELTERDCNDDGVLDAADYPL